MKTKMKALLHAANAICSSMHLDEILKRLIKEINEVVDQTDVIFVFLHDQDTDLLMPCYSYGIDEHAFQHMIMKPGESIAGWVFKNRQSLLCATRDCAMQAMQSMASTNLNHYRQAVPDGRYPESAICAPIIYRDECLGVLTIDRFVEGKPYRESDSELLESMASMAAVAIANARMYGQVKASWVQMRELNAIITSTSEQLVHAIDINKVLAMVSLTGQGIDKMCETLSGTMECQVVILDEFGDMMTSCPAPDSASLRSIKNMQLKMMSGNRRIEELREWLPDERCYLAPVSDGTFHIGYILMIDVKKTRDMAARVCDMASLLLAIEILRVEREKQYREDQIADSLKGLLDGKNDEAILERLRTICPYITKSQYVISIIQADQIAEHETYRHTRHTRYAILKYIKTRMPKSVYMIKDDYMIVLYPFVYTCTAPDLYKQIKAINAGLFQTLKDSRTRIRIGTGEVVLDLNALPRSYASAHKALLYLNKSGITKDSQFYHELGMRKLLFRNSQEELYQYYVDTLGPILRYDEEKGACLMETLYTLKHHNQSLATSAEDLNVHKNTLSYRLKKIRELLGLDVDDMRRHEIQIALEIGEFLSESKYIGNAAIKEPFKTAGTAEKIVI